MTMFGGLSGVTPPAEVVGLIGTGIHHGLRLKLCMVFTLAMQPE